MPKSKLPDWKPWHEERERFNVRVTEGYIKDMAALKAHILKLQEIVPRDETGWMPSKANLELLELQANYHLYNSWAKELLPSKEAL